MTALSKDLEAAGGGGNHDDGVVVVADTNTPADPTADDSDDDVIGNNGLDKHSDPFAPREGKTLIWLDVNMTLAPSTRNSKDEPQPGRKLLHDVWGEVPPKETTAIMGPSGAGKSSLLNILSGRERSRGRLTITNDIRLNNYTVDPTKMSVRKLIAFVAQDDSLQVTSTPRESIRFSAKLRLPRSTTESELDKLTERMISELGLSSCADTMVGGRLIKGISGGERKRTSVGVELVVKPALVFLDEPTSGLDSFSAVQLCQVLKKVANAGASVLFTIHQPSSEIFNSFDRLILLNKGRVMYQGPVQNVPEYFGERGHPNPTNYNPADWIMNVAQSVSMEELDRCGFFPKDGRDLGSAFTPASGDGRDALGLTISRTGSNSNINSKTNINNNKDGSRPYDDRQRSMITQVSMLFHREMNNLIRDTAALCARFGLTLFLSALIGIIFWKVGETDSNNPTNLQSHFGALIMVLIMGMFGTAQPALLAFPDERPVFLREYSTNHYSVISYFVSRFTIEATITALQIFTSLIVTYYMISLQGTFLIHYANAYSLAMASTALAVMLGCSVEDPKLGQELLPLLFVPQMLFAGFFVAPGLIPSWLRWARFAMTLTYAVRIALIEEFHNNCGPDAQEDCDRLLSNVYAEHSDLKWNWGVMIGLFAFFRLLALFILRNKATKFY